MSGNMTNFARLTEEQKTAWSLDFWKRARNASFVEKFTGTGPNSMIQRVTELRKNEKGARAVLTLLSDMQGDGVAGDRQLEGNEEALLSHDRVIRMDQLRDANIQEGRMADQKSIVNFRFTSRDMLAYWISDRIDQMAFLTLAGVTYARGTNGVLRPVTDLTNLEFAADVLPPSDNRRLRWNNATKRLEANAATSDIVATDTPSYAMLVELKAYARSRYMRGMRGNDGEDLYHVFLSPQAMAKLKLDPDYIANLRNAGPRSSNNQLFAGGVTTVDGLVIHDFRHVYNTSGLPSGSKWGDDGTVDGCSVLFCGAQALGMADIGAPIWDEKTFDYGNRLGIAVGKIFGLLKPQFPNIYEGGSTEDFGVINCFVAQ